MGCRGRGRRLAGAVRGRAEDGRPRRRGKHGGADLVAGEDAVLVGLAAGVGRAWKSSETDSTERMRMLGGSARLRAR